MYQILPSNLLYPTILTMLSLILILTTCSSISSWTFKEKMEVKVSAKSTSLVSFLSLFVSFDPNSSISIWFFTSLNWLIIVLVPVLIMSLSIWSTPTRFSVLTANLFTYLKVQFSIALKTKNDSSQTILCSIFLLILCSNFFGLIPHSFTPTSHLTLNLFLGLSLWMGFILFGWLNFTNKMLAHLVPSMTPLPLISFMVIIEMVSNIIRPLTLSVRLMANMVSGHLLLTLIGNSLVLAPVGLFILSFLAQSVLLMLELGVGLIQAYVFCMLMTLYSDESEYNVINK